MLSRLSWIIRPHSNLLTILSAVIIIFFLTIEFDIYPLVLKLFEFKREKIKLENSLKVLEDQSEVPFETITAQLSRRAITQGELMKNLIDISQSSGVMLQFGDPVILKKIYDDQGFEMNVSLLARFPQFTEFIKMLDCVPVPMFPIEFHIHASPNKLKQIDLRLMGFYLIKKTNDKKMQLISRVRDPFEKQMDGFILSNQFESKLNCLTSYSLGQFKFVGFLKHKNRIWGLAKLPNQLTVEFETGSFLGTERARVLQLGETEIWLDQAGQVMRINFDGCKVKTPIEGLSPLKKRD